MVLCCRSLEGDWPYLWFDATYVKVRQDGRIVSLAMIVPVGFNTDGWHKGLGMDIGPSEAEPLSTAFRRHCPTPAHARARYWSRVACGAELTGLRAQPRADARAWNQGNGDGGS